MKRIFLFSAFIIALFFVACSQNEKEIIKDEARAPLQDSEINVGGEPSQNNPSQTIPVPDKLPLSADSVALSSKSPQQIAFDWDKKLIKNASVKMEVKDFRKSGESIRQTIRKSGGYISQEEQNLLPEKSETVMTIKVPVDRFEDLLNELSAQADKVVERKINTDDVTNDYVDTKSRLEAKKQMRLKYLEFLKQSKNMEEVLQVQREINSIQEAIESASGRVGHLSREAAMSTISLSYYQPLAVAVPEDSDPSFFSRFSKAFSTGADWLKELLIGIISIWPIALILVIILIFIRKRRLLHLTDPVQPPVSNQNPPIKS